MSVRRLALQVLGTAAVTSALALAPTGAVYAAGATVVHGVMYPDNNGACTEPAAFTAVVTGSLTGCWYGDTITFDHANANGNIVARGTEHFVGCLGSGCGTFTTTFTFTAKYDGDTEEHGRCHHPITGGTGAFAGASGVINMHDEPDGCVDYQGTISVG
jgi:hypothetical protein